MSTRALGNASSTFSLFTNLSTHFRHCHYASNILLDSVTQFEKLVQTRCQSRDLSLSEALGYFDSILEMKLMPSIWSLNQLLGSLSKMKQCSTVVSMYTHLTRFRSVDFDPDISTMNIVIKCLCQSKDAQLGFSVLGSALKRGIGYNSRTLDTLLDGLCRQNSMVSAMELFEKIEEENDGSCNEVTYGTIINGFCKSGESRKALELLRKMLVDNGAKPDPYCFSSVINCLSKDGLIDEAVSLFQSITSLGGRPDVVCYTSLIHGLCKTGRQEEAKSFLMEMVGLGVSPNVYTYTVLIDSLCKGEKINEALGLFEDMIVRGIVPNIFCYNSLIVGLSKSGNWKEVSRVLEKMKVHRVSPNIVTLNSILDARFKEGSTLAALSLVGVMVEKRLFPDNVVLNGLCCSSARSEEAEILSCNMESSNVVVDTVTLNVLLSGLSAGFMVMEARGLFEEMVDRGQANFISFNAMINGYCSQGEMGEAKEIFDRMETNGASPNVVTYNTLVNGYLKIGRVDLAFGILKDFVLKGLRPDRGIRNVLKAIHAYRHESGFDSPRQGTNVLVDCT